MDSRLVIGKNQLLPCEEQNCLTNAAPPILNPNLENSLSLMVFNNYISSLQNEIFKMFNEWEQLAYPQIWVEKMVKQIVGIIEKSAPNFSTNLSITLDQQIDEVIYLSKDFSGLLRGIWDIIEGLLLSSNIKKDNKANSAELLNKIESYCKKNFAMPITLQSICDLFGISQPYLSRLFRTNKNLSFNEYITSIRINEARRILLEHPGTLSKDVAEMVGYQDQHYFSRIFKSIVGKTPSEYRESPLNNP